MVKKFDDNFEFHPNLIFDILDSASGHIIDMTLLQKQKKSKKELINNISAIKQKKQGERLNTDTFPLERYENYGLQVRGNTALSRNIVKTSRQCFKKQSSKKSRTKLFKENLSPNDRVHTDYDCELVSKQKKKKLSGYKIFTKALSPPVKEAKKTKAGPKMMGCSSLSRLHKKY